MVAQPWRRAGKLGILSALCVAPLWLRGLRGKQSTPSIWLGGTVVVSTVGKRELCGAGATQARVIIRSKKKGKGMFFILVVEYVRIMWFCLLMER